MDLKKALDKVTKAARAAHRDALADLLAKRTATPTKRVEPKPFAPVPSGPIAPKRTRRTGRVGFRRYKAAPLAYTMLDRVRSGTFRKYMLTTILAYDTTHKAQGAHILSGSYPDHKLDFAWAADNGYIEFE